MTEEELRKEATSLIEDYHSLLLYQRYLALKKAVEEDRRLQSLAKKRKTIQDGIRFLGRGEKEKAIAEAKALEDAYDEDPKTVNLRAVREELLSLLLPLTETRF
jgi:cell fate (sporulation/competence/biofilm development) regulator YlbF (YheA/YmcA/DUF963 family)